MVTVTVIDYQTAFFALIVINISFYIALLIKYTKQSVIALMIALGMIYIQKNAILRCADRNLYFIMSLNGKIGAIHNDIIDGKINYYDQIISSDGLFYTYLVWDKNIKYSNEDTEPISKRFTAQIGGESKCDTISSTLVASKTMITRIQCK